MTRFSTIPLYSNSLNLQLRGSSAGWLHRPPRSDSKHWQNNIGRMTCPFLRHGCTAVKRWTMSVHLRILLWGEFELINDNYSKIYFTPDRLQVMMLRIMFQTIQERSIPYYNHRRPEFRWLWIGRHCGLGQWLSVVWRPASLELYAAII